MTIKDANVLYDLIDRIRKVYMESQGEKIRIFTADEFELFKFIDRIVY